MADSKGQIVERPVKVTSSYGKEVPTTLRINEWSAEERSSHVWKRLAMWWGAALFAALVPPHIPWFTLAFIGGMVAAWLASRQGAMVQTQEVACPDCGTHAQVEERPETWPLGVRCSPCGNVFWISQDEPAKARA